MNVRPLLLLSVAVAAGAVFTPVLLADDADPAPAASVVVQDAPVPPLSLPLPADRPVAVTPATAGPQAAPETAVKATASGGGATTSPVAPKLTGQPAPATTTRTPPTTPPVSPPTAATNPNWCEGVHRTGCPDNDYPKPPDTGQEPVKPGLVCAPEYRYCLPGAGGTNSGDHPDAEPNGGYNPNARPPCRNDAGC